LIIRSTSRGWSSIGAIVDKAPIVHPGIGALEAPLRINALVATLGAKASMIDAGVLLPMHEASELKSIYKKTNLCHVL
jgi:hypothetical protein